MKSLPILPSSIVRDLLEGYEYRLVHPKDLPESENFYHYWNFYDKSLLTIPTSEQIDGIF